MRAEYETLYHQVEQTHWWHQARRHLVRALARQLLPDRTARILEIGCSGGPLLAQLRADGYADLTGIDVSVAAIARCRERGLTNTQVMDAQRLSFPDAAFALVIASDVLEHLRDDAGALAEWRRVLAPGGRLVVLVPAFAFLWSEHDEINQHVRRYRRPQLCALLRQTGFTVERSGYWNFLLFPPVAAIRLARRLRPKSTAPARGDIFPTPKAINRLLLAMLRVENWWLLRGLNFPFGVSVLAVARRPEAPAVGPDH